MYTEKIAIIDIGSNTIRLVIYGIDKQFNYIELQNIKTPARLSRFLSQDGEETIMKQKGINRLIHTLISFQNVCRTYEVDNIRPMATAAIRQSDNKKDIFRQVKEVTGLDIEVVSEREEALYGQYAVTHTNMIPTAITIDIGGGSCEITYFENKESIHYQSFPFGVVSLQNRFFKDKDHNDPEAMEALRNFVRKQFKGVDWIKKAKVPIIAIGGSARNVATVHQMKTNYPMAGIHGYEMNQENLDETLGLFVNTPYNKLSDIDGLSNDRIDLIIPATLVFQELYRTVKAKNFTLSSQGLREGIVLKYINDKYNQPIDTKHIRQRAIAGIIRDLPIDTFGSERDIFITLQLFDNLVEWGQLPDTEDLREELKYASYLYQFGSFISSESESQHTFYILSNMNLLGFSHQKRLRLALLASYRNRSLYRQYMESFDGWLTDEESELIMTIGGVLKFAKALNDSKTAPIQDIKLTKDDDNHYELNIYHNQPIVAEEYRANRHKKHLQRALDGSLSLNFIEERAI